MTDRLLAGPRGAGTRPLRRDAELNLARILSAARDVFAEHGYEASMEQIAARAGLGVGTLYRRFPNKGELVAAVIAAASRRTEQIARSVLADAPAAEGVFTFLRRCVAVPSCWRVIASRAPGTDYHHQHVTGPDRPSGRHSSAESQGGRGHPPRRRLHRPGRSPHVGPGRGRPL